VARRLDRRELLVLVAILALAALLRLPGLDQRGRWDADQGHDMLVLRALVTQGEVPLLGPPTSIGTFHHGAAYYYLLAPAAFLSGADPVAVTGEIALVGCAAVAAAWWLARLIGGPLAGLAAALLAAVSPAGIDESTFIWNPNLIPLASALAFGAAIRAWQAGRPRWWLLAAAGAMVTMQCHMLGVVVLPPLALAYLADVRRRRRTAGASLRPLLLAGLGGALIVAAGYVPLVIHELGHNFSETRAIVDYIAGGGRSSDALLVGRIAMVGLRSVAWPLAGLVSDRPAAAAGAVIVAVGLMGISVMAGRGGGEGGVPTDRRPFALWLAGTLAWSILALAIFAPSLAVITPGLPNDHYHAFLDPLVLALAGVGLARIASGTAQRSAAAQRKGVVPMATAAGLGLVLLVVGVIAWPPATADDGGWKLADEAAARVVREAAGSGGVELVGIPPFKSADALRFPLERRGLVPADGGLAAATGTAGTAVVVCDPLFNEVVGAACGGAAEDAWLAGTNGRLRLLDRFDAGSRRTVSIYVGSGQ
jgi:Dolichyl-phosphate-mannose-protein mannosyltransferase